MNAKYSFKAPYRSVVVDYQVARCIVALLASGAVLATYTAGVPDILSLDRLGLRKVNLLHQAVGKNSIVWYNW